MLLVAATCVPGAFAQSSTTFSGEATVLSGTVAGVPLNVAGTGPLDPGGGARNNSLVCYPDGPNCQVGITDLTNGAIAIQLLNASTVGRGNHSRANASVAELAITVNGAPIEVAFLQSAAQAACAAGVAAVQGGSEVADLFIAGVPTEVSGLPNQTIALPGGVTIIINEQTGPGGPPVQNGNRGDITVNALHITAPQVGIVPATDVIVSQAHADITCGQPSCNFADKVTSGGFVALAGGGKGSFAAAGRNASDWGHFIFVNHATRQTLKATRIATTFTTEGVAEITGVGQVDGQGEHSFTVRLKDNGEPGHGADMFGLTSSHPSFNVADGTIAGGNIQFHRPCGGGQ
jgi:hypothetical protein